MAVSPDPVPMRRAMGEASVVAALAVALTGLALRIWTAPLRLPWDTRRDATLISAMVKNTLETGWFSEQPRLGAPFGQNLADFPHGGETFQLAVVRVITGLVDDWGLAMNIYFVVGAGALAAVTHLVLRHLRFSALPAAVAALLFTALPYRFGHGQMHLWRSTYVSAPLAALLLIWLATWRERFLVDPHDRTARIWQPGHLRWRRVMAAVAVAAIIAGTETMTTAFTMTLVMVTALVGAARHRDVQRLLVAIGAVGVMAVTFAVLSLPTLLHYRAEGTNAEAARRFTTESEWYGLKLTRLVLPEPGHRVGFMSQMGEAAQEETLLRSERGQALGIIGTIGFVGLGYASVTRRRGTEPDPTTPVWHRSALRDCGVVTTVTAVAFGTIGGLSVVMAMIGFGQVRVWNRIMLFVAFFAMIEVLTRAEQVRGWWVARRGQLSRPMIGAVALLVLTVGLIDGIPVPRASYAEIEARHASDRALVAAIEGTLPEGAAVFQVPVLDFPETVPPGRMEDYDPLRAYLADSGRLRWSYGAVRGRPSADWQDRVRDEVGLIGSLPALLGLGFQGLWVDTWGYEAGSPDGAEVDQLPQVLGVDPLRSPDGRFLFYDLRPYRKTLGRSSASLAGEARRVLGVDVPVGD